MTSRHRSEIVRCQNVITLFYEIMYD